MVATVGGVFGFIFILEYNPSWQSSSTDYFIGNTIPGGTTYKSYFNTYQIVESLIPLNTYFTSVDAWDFDKDGIDELVTGGYYGILGSEKPAFCVWDHGAAAGFYVSFATRYNSYHASIEGRINTVSIADLNNNGNGEVVLGGYSLRVRSPTETNIYADLRVAEIMTTMSLFTRSVAMWQYAPTVDVFSWTGTPTNYYSTYKSWVQDLAIADVNFDDVLEICTAGSMFLTNEYFGQNHVFIFNSSTLALQMLTYTRYYDSNPATEDYSYYNAIEVGNVDYDAEMELVFGGWSSTTSRAVHDFLAVQDSTRSGTMSPTYFEDYEGNYLGNVILNEIDTGTVDRVELFNQGNPQDMTGWYLEFYDYNTYSPAYSVTYTFPAGYVLGSLSYVIVLETTGTNNQTHLYAGVNFPWATRQMACALKNAEGRTVDWWQANSYTGVRPPDAIWQDDTPLSVLSQVAARTSFNDNGKASDWAVAAAGTFYGPNPGQTGYPNSASVVAVDINDVDSDGVPEIVSLMKKLDGGYFIATYNKTLVDDKKNPDLVSMNDSSIFMGGNVTLFSDDFDGGSFVSKWEEKGDMWHVTGDGSAWNDSYHSWPNSAWFGMESTGTYNDGRRAYGSLVSMPFDLSRTTTAYLDFYHWRQTEGGIYDVSYVDISTDGYSWINLYVDQRASVAPWERVVLDISGYTGNPHVRIRFMFDTVDSGYNDFRGWLVDDVKVYTNLTTQQLGVLVTDRSPVNLLSTASGVWATVPFTSNPWITGVTFDEDATGIAMDTVHLATLNPNNWNTVSYAGEQFCEDGDYKYSMMNLQVYYDTQVPVVELYNQDYKVTSNVPWYDLWMNDNTAIRARWYSVFIPSQGSWLGPVYFDNYFGLLETSIWNQLPEEEVVYWYFYAEDRVGNIGQAMVHIEKDTSIAELDVSTVMVPFEIVQGQEYVPVSVTVYNNGDNDAFINALGLEMKLNETYYVTYDFNIQEQFSLPTVIPAYSSMQFDFWVFVNERAMTGAVEVVDAYCYAQDVRTYDDVSVYSSTSPGLWWVLKSANLQITGMDDVPDQDTYVQEMTFIIGVTLTNYGDATVYLDALNLEFRTSSGSLASGYYHDPVTGYSILGGQTITIDVTVYTDPWCTTGDITVDAVAQGWEDITWFNILAFSQRERPFAFGGASSDIAYDAMGEGNYIYTVGYTLNFGASGADAFIVKWDKAGNVMWFRTWGGSGSEYAYGVWVQDREIFVTGQTNSFSASNDLFLLKYDVDGNLLWNQSWVSSGHDYGRDVSVRDGLVYVVGYSNFPGSYDMLLACWDTYGNLYWLEFSRAIPGRASQTARRPRIARW